jgi:WD40 repeat protein
VGTYGETVVIDWGLAKSVTERDELSLSQVDAPSSGVGLTKQGVVMGTPGYMSPEQAAGKPVDSRTDVFALGACLRFLITGVRPGALATQGPEHEWLTAAKAVHASVPKDLVAIVRCATAVNPADRYPDAKALADDLNRFLARQPVLAHRYSFSERLTRWVQKHRALTVATVAMVLASAGIASVAAVRETVLRRKAETSAGALMELQGRSELAAGRPRRAAVYLAEALRLAPDDSGLHMLLSQAVQPLAAPRVALLGMTRDVVSVAWSPDSQWIATGGDDEAVRVWRATSGELVKVATHHAKGIDVVAFSDDSRWLASGGLDDAVHVVNLETGNETAAFRANAYRLAWSPDRRRLVAGTQEGPITIHDADTGAPLQQLKHHTNRIQHLSFSPSGELVAASWDRTVSMWDPVTFELKRVLSDFEAEVVWVAYSHGGEWAAIAESDASIHMYSLPSWKRSHRIRTPEGARFPSISFSHDDAELIANSAEGVVRFWHVNSGNLLATIDVQTEGKLFSSAMRPDGQELVTGGLSGRAVIWSLKDVLDHRVLPLGPGVRPNMNPAAVSAKGWVAMPEEQTGKVQLWNNGGTLPVARMDVGPRPASLAISDSAHTLLVNHELSGHRDALLLRLETGEVVAKIPHPRLVMNIAVSRDGQFFATACYDGAARVIEARTGEVLRTFQVSTDRLSAVAFSTDGSELAVAEGKGVVSFLDSATGAVHRTLVAHPTWVQDVEFSPDGQRVVTAGRQDHHVKVWSYPGLQRLHDFENHTNNVMRASFSANGKWIATVGVDHQALLFDASSGRLLRSWRGPSYSAEFMNDDAELLTTGYDGYAVVWSIKRDARTSQELIDVVGMRAPWRLVDGALVLKHDSL